MALDKDDIIKTLDLEGDSYVVTGTGDTVESAVESAISNIPCRRWQVKAMAIVLWYGTGAVDVSDMNSLSNTLSLFRSEPRFVWGVYSDSALGDSFKVTVVASTSVKYSAWRKAFSDMRERRRLKMLKRHAFLSDIVKGYTNLEDFAHDKTEFFEMMGVELGSDDSYVSLYFQLDYNEYENYFVVPTGNGRLAVSHVIWWQNEKCANEILDIFTDETYHDDDLILTNY